MHIKKTLRAIAWLILGFVTFAATWLLAALLLSLFTVNPHPLPGRDVTIFIITNGDHTDIVVPVKNSIKDWSSEVKFTNTISRGTNAKYVALGWGDKEFFLNTPTWSQLKLSVAFKAAFALSSAAIHATFYKSIRQNEDCRQITISNSQYTRLVAYIDNTFKRDAAGNVINIKTTANYDNNDAFYEAKGKYNLFYTCNTWANNALKACGQKACVWTPFDKGIFRLYRN
jgi:uncharacterized protein (TIGR02117 family)